MGVDIKDHANVFLHVSFKEEFLATETEKERFIKENLNDLCASVQQRIVSILLNKLKKASIETGIKDLCIAGGVSANSHLRKAFDETGKKYGWKTFIPAFQYCTDNAAMIAIAGYYKFLANQVSDLTVTASARAEW